MSLRDVLQGIVENETPILLGDGDNEWEASDLLAKLSEPMLKRQAYMQQGPLYCRNKRWRLPGASAL